MKHFSSEWRDGFEDEKKKQIQFFKNTYTGIGTEKQQKTYSIVKTGNLKENQYLIISVEYIACVYDNNNVCTQVAGTRWFTSLLMAYDDDV